MKTAVAWIVVLATLVGVAFGVMRYRAAHAAPDVVYRTANVERRRITSRVTASGTLQATVTVQVGSQVSGRIAKILVDFNSPVKKGQLVAKIDPQLFQAAVASAHANYASAKANVAKSQATVTDAERQFERAKKLAAEGLASATDLQTAETTLAVSRAGVDVAKAAVEQATASLSQAQVNLSYTDIFSPIDGTVISRSIDVGQTVAASLQAPVLFTIAEDFRTMQVNSNVSESDVGRLSQGMTATFTVDAFPGQKFQGTIAQIRNAAQTVQNVVTYDAVVDVANPDLKLRPGMTANVTFVWAEKDGALAVPNAALRFRPPESAAASAPPSAGAAPSGSARRGRPGQGGKGGDDMGTDPAPKSIYRLDNGAPAQLQVRTGLTDGSFTEIVSGELKEGDPVVLDATSSKAPAAASGGGAQPNAMRRMF